ncbi:gamma subclass chorismate mutase AroQ [Uliginosibacterium gangwonense]|uniref:gamma subclass chorismate mutase AroQ n=1 Tax=Uliginosibacterium gangwonense TaxID=392736 RepID=UPI0003AA06BE|nr:gamma subclass chorismate mutase AroQ [Uliginosibacterium gangwonense]
MNSMKKMLTCCTMLCALIYSTASHAEIPKAVGNLLTLTAERLAIATEVAQSKWNSHGAIEDLGREKQVIGDTTALATKQGVTEQLARDFISAQIEANKTVQWTLHRQWTQAQAPAFEQAPDLARDIRPHLDKLTPLLVEALAKAAPQLTIADAQELIAARPEGADPLAWKVAIAPLTARAQAKAGESRLDIVQRSGLLRICMTGDYKPFTLWRKDLFAFEGVDAEIGRQLAASLHADVQFVATTWATLMPDLLANRCDLVSGGVSITTDRARLAAFSVPVQTDGKTPIVRCADKVRFQTLEQIDQPNVRVIVNPGGTNERFARSEIKRAMITVFPDNVTIFDEILQNRADVMMTDAIETQLQQKQHPGLCAVHPEAPFTVSEKAYLLPRGDVVFKEYVDHFLHIALIEGQYRNLLDGWLK